MPTVLITGAGAGVAPSGGRPPVDAGADGRAAAPVILGQDAAL